MADPGPVVTLDDATRIDDPTDRAAALRAWQLRAERMLGDDFRAARAQTVRDLRDEGVPWVRIVGVFGVSERYLRAEAEKVAT